MIQSHGGICESEKLDDDLRYIGNIAKRTAEHHASGKTVEQASKVIRPEDCVTKERFQFLAGRFGSLLWCHPENVRRIFREIEAKTSE